MSALRSLRAAAAAVFVVGLAAIVAGPVASASAATTAAPPAGLSIAITDHVSEVQPGSAVQYTATVTNLGARAVTGTLAVTVPDYAKASGDTASWTVTVEPGKTASRTLDATIGTIPKGEVRVTALATLFARGSSTQILVRSADPDLIKGVRDPAQTVRPAAASAPTVFNAGIVFAVILLVVVALGVALAVFLIWTRKRRRHPGRVPTQIAAGSDRRSDDG
jgi:hypothetical protein